MVLIKILKTWVLCLSFFCLSYYYFQKLLILDDLKCLFSSQVESLNYTHSLVETVCLIHETAVKQTFNLRFTLFSASAFVNRYKKVCFSKKEYPEKQQPWRRQKRKSNNISWGSKCSARFGTESIWKKCLKDEGANLDLSVCLFSAPVSLSSFFVRPK